LLYDEVDPGSLMSGIVRLDGKFFGALWQFCGEHELSVVADVHTHPGSPEQSPSDRDNPIISRAGHIALILPNFAMGFIPRRDIGIYEYQGAKTWKSIANVQRRSFFHIGF